jgi:hypothetical protein
MIALQELWEFLHEFLPAQKFSPLGENFFLLLKFSFGKFSLFQLE